MSTYLAPQSLEQALNTLKQPSVKIIAGGTDLMIEFRKLRKNGEKLPEIILDVTNIPELNRFEINDSKTFLGAAATFAKLEKHPEIKAKYPVLAKASQSVGSAQIRQTATIGGNVGNASPAADGTSALVALGAKALIASPNENKSLLVEDFLKGPYKNGLEKDEIIIGYELDSLPVKNGQAFGKVGRRQAVAVARLNVAVVLTKDMADPRLVLSSCFPTCRRLKTIEHFLASEKPCEKTFDQAGDMAQNLFVDVCGIRSSATYKRPAISRMVSRVLSQAWAKLEAAS